MKFRTYEMKMEMVKMYREFGDVIKAREILESIDISQESPSMNEEQGLLSNVPEEVIFEEASDDME